MARESRQSAAGLRVVVALAALVDRVMRMVGKVGGGAWGERGGPLWLGSWKVFETPGSFVPCLRPPGDRTNGSSRKSRHPGIHRVRNIYQTMCKSVYLHLCFVLILFHACLVQEMRICPT